MQVKLSVRHGHLNDEHQQQIRDKAERLLRYFGRLTLIEVTVDLQDPIRKEVEFRATAEHKHEFVACEGHPELLGAMELAFDKITHQINKYKERIQDHRRDPSTGEVAGAPPVEDRA